MAYAKHLHYAQIAANLSIARRGSVGTTRRILLGIFLLVTVAYGDDSGNMRKIPNRATLQPAVDDQSIPKTYIVQLKQPSASEALMRSSGKGTAAASSGVMQSFNKSNPVVESYANKLGAEQDAVLRDIGTSVQKIYSYRYSLNGFAAKMSPAHANKLKRDERVLRVWEDEIRPLVTRSSPSFLGLFDADVGLRGTPGLDGDGIIIGVIDSGIAPNHPSLSDTREADRPGFCRGSFAETSLLGLWLCRRFKIRDDILEFDEPENWSGICESGDGFPDGSCNNKVIGARIFAQGALASMPIDPEELLSPADVFGHGTHVATTAAGNKADVEIYGISFGRAEGIAPKARIAVYKACWVRTGDIAATCNTSDLANAIDTAVADGVHLINYSVGSTMLDLVAPDDIALIGAAKAGILTVVAAGNEGPGLGTIGSPAGNPAVITVAASSRDGEHSREAIEVASPPSVASLYPVREAVFTPRLQGMDPIEAELVLVDDGDDTQPDGSPGTTYDGCEPIDNGDELAGNIAFMQRSGCAFDIMVENADDAGAIAAVIFNIAGDPVVMFGASGFSDIPAVMMGQADGMLLFDELNDGQTVEMVLDKNLLLTETDEGNVMATFSSRGPGTSGDILKPDVTAPGINILAGNTPLSITGMPDENYAFLSGTSMSTPHVTGVAALLRQAHPTWSPAAIKSALITTARQDVFQPDASTPANAFDYGAGHIAPNTANNPGLVYDLSDDDYDAYSCGIDSPDVDQARCDELIAAGKSFDAAQMNQPSISISRLTGSQTVSRTVSNVSDESESYSLEIEAPSGINLQVTPPSITVAPGQSVSYDVTASFQSGPLDLWRFGTVTWRGADHIVRSPVAVLPSSVAAPGEVFSTGTTDTFTFPVDFGYTGTYLPRVHGLNFADTTSLFVDEDPSKTFTRRLGGGVQLQTFSVPANQAFIRFELRDEFTDGDDDLDMYVYYSPDGDFFTRVAVSGESTSEERVTIFDPPAGFYEIFIHGFDTDNSVGGGGAGANFCLLAWQLGLNDDAGNMTATGPAAVTAGTTGDITIDWANLSTDSIHLGAVSHNSPQGPVDLTIVRIDNLQTANAPGNCATSP